MPIISPEIHLKKIDKQPAAIYVLHERAERSFPMHSHRKGQLSYVQGGIAYLFMGSQSYVIPGRHFLWLPGGVEHYVQARQPSSQMRTLYFPPQRDRKHPFYSKVGIYPINDLLYQMIVYTEKWGGDILPKAPAFSFLKAIKDILPDFTSGTLPFMLPTTQNTRLRPIVLYLRNNVAQALTLGSVSREFGLSERSLSRLFKAELDISFLQYLQQVRMLSAVEMILQTDMTLSQIAYEVGYGSLAAFSSTFQQLYHIRPSEFERRVK